MNKIATKSKILKSAAIAVAVTGASSLALAASDEGFQKLYTVFGDWFTGNLGKVLALLGFAGTFIVYMMTHKGSVLFVGIIISLLAGGLVGIADMFFNVGSTTFNS
jgi:hypothetical protein